MAKKQKVECKIDWSPVPVDKWRALFAKTHRAPITQSYEYAQAICKSSKKKASWGVVHINDQPAGLVQITQAGILNNIVHAIELDLGPIWFENFGSAEHYGAFFETYNKQFPKRFGRARRILVNAPASDTDMSSIQDQLSKLRMKKHETSPYQTLWVDLSTSKEELRKALKSKWRNMLNKGEKQSMHIEFTDDLKGIPLILKHYELDKITKDYNGPSVALIKDLCVYFGPQKNVLIGKASLDNKLIAAIVVFVHGGSATYQIGWSSEDGRKNAAHNVLLWNALCTLKDKGIKHFDLGGINDETAKNVKRFKEGLGGIKATSPGQYT